MVSIGKPIALSDDRQVKKQYFSWRMRDKTFAGRVGSNKPVGHHDDVYSWAWSVKLFVANADIYEIT